MNERMTLLNRTSGLIAYTVGLWSLLCLFVSLPVALADDHASSPEKYIANIQSLTDGDWIFLKSQVDKDSGYTRYIFNAKMYAIDVQLNEVKDDYRLVSVVIDNLALFEAQIKHFGKPTPLDDNKPDSNNLHKAKLPFNDSLADGNRYFFHDEEVRRAVALGEVLGTQSHFVRRAGERTKFLYYFSESLAADQVENFSFSTAHPKIIKELIKKLGRFIVPHGFNNDNSHEILLFPDHELAIAKQLAVSLGYDLSIVRSYGGEAKEFIFSDKKSNFKFAINALQRNKDYDFEVLNVANYVNKIGAKKFKKYFAKKDNVETFKKLQSLIKLDKPTWKLLPQMSGTEVVPSLKFSYETKKPELNYGMYYSPKNSDWKKIKNPEILIKKYFPDILTLNSCRAFYL